MVILKFSLSQKKMTIFDTKTNVPTPSLSIFFHLLRNCWNNMWIFIW